MHNEIKLDCIFFLGLDYSTQQLKSLLFNGLGKLINEEKIDYDSDLSHYGTVNGVLSLDYGVVCAPSAMWIEATDLLFTRLSSKFELYKIVALSGSAQQHTTMFWGTGANERLETLDSDKLLVSQLGNVFSRPLSASWMDSSTTEECRTLIDLFGGESGYQKRFGSSLAKRFSGPQIMRAFKNDDSLDSRTESITLVSNGMCSIYRGMLVGMDLSDAAGTGLQQGLSLEWDSEICSAISSSLQQKLGRITPSNSVTGYLCDYFVKRYKMNPHCKVVNFTGDNPSSVVGMQLNERDLCLSMGTSDTVFACSLERPVFVPNVPLFVFPHPLYPDVFVTLICYKNGAKMRQRLCEECCGGSFDDFSQYLAATPAGNNGLLGLFYDSEEITPSGLRGRFLFEQETNRLVSESEVIPPRIIRSLIEGQILAKYYHYVAINKGNKPPISKLLVTGGASANKEILQVAADIFGVPLFTVEHSNSAAMGSICRAVIATQGEQFSNEFVQKMTSLRQTCVPQDHAVYESTRESFFDFFQF